MAGPFDSAWLKWYWAVLHAEALEADIKRFDEDPNRQKFIETRTEYHPKRHAFAVIVESLVEIPTSWGLALGDVAANYRGALDHLAWALVSRGRTPPATLSDGAQRRVQFPIANSPSHFSSIVRKRLPGARRADIAVVRRYQPYQADQRRRGKQCLSILASLNNDDKHRNVQPVLTWPVGGGYRVKSRRDCVVTETRTKARAVPLQVGAEGRTVRVRKTGPNPQLEVEVALSAQVILENTVPIVTWFDNAKAWIASLLLEFSDPPDEPPALGAHGSSG